MKLKNVLIALLMIIGTTLMAQEKYEQAVIVQNSGFYIYVSVEGKEVKKTKLTPFSNNRDVTALLKEVALMRDEGWEVWNSTVSGGSEQNYDFTYFLRRKLK